MQLLLRLSLESHVALHQIGELGLTFLVDRRCKLALTFKELLVFLIEFLFGTLQLSLILAALVGHLLLQQSHVGHCLEYFTVTEETEKSRWNILFSHRIGCFGTFILSLHGQGENCQQRQQEELLNRFAHNVNMRA